MIQFSSTISSSIWLSPSFQLLFLISLFVCCNCYSPMSAVYAITSRMWRFDHPLSISLCSILCQRYRVARDFVTISSRSLRPDQQFSSYGLVSFFSGSPRLDPKLKIWYPAHEQWKSIFLSWTNSGFIGDVFSSAGSMNNCSHLPIVFHSSNSKCWAGNANVELFSASLKFVQTKN